jgi:NitT/TauT family transport system permease protein
MVGDVKTQTLVVGAVGKQSGRGLRRRTRTRVLATQLGLVVGFIALWQILGNLGIINSFLFGSPWGIAQILWRWIADGTLLTNTAVTLYEAAVGFVIAFVIAIPLGIALARSSFWDRVTSPFIDMANATPRFALAPVFVFIFGLGSMMKIALVFSVVFFVLLINTMAGTKAIEEDYIRLGRISGASRAEMFGKVILPATGGYILAGLRLSVPYALAAAVVGEMFSGNSGLGYLVSNQAGLLVINGVFAAVIVLALFGWALNSIVNALVARTPWARMAQRATV